MNRFDKMNYTDKIKWRIRFLWLALVLMLIYMIVVGETGGDSRVMTAFARSISSLIFWGGLIFIACQIYQNKQLLKSRALLKEQLQSELDERNQYLHDKSGGTVLDILLLFLLFTTTTAGLFNMAAFYTSFTILAAAVLLKAVAYWVYHQI